MNSELIKLTNENLNKLESGEDKESSLSHDEETIEITEFDQCAKDYEQIIAEVSNNPHFHPFREQLTNLWKSACLSKEKEEKLTKKIILTNSEIVATNARLSILQKNFSNDPYILIDLKTELENVRKKVKEAKTKEGRVKEELKRVVYETEQINLFILEDPDFSIKVDGIKSLVEKNEELNKERNHIMEENSSRIKEIDNLKEQIHELQTEKTIIQMEITQLSKDIQMKNNEETKENKKSEKIKAEHEMIRNDQTIKERELNRIKGSIDRSKQEIYSKEVSIEDSHKKVEELNKEIERLNHHSNDNQTLFNQYREDNDRLQQSVNEGNTDIKKKEEEIINVKQEIKKVEKSIENIKKQIETIEASRKMISDQRREIKELNNECTAEILAMKKNREREKKAGDALSKERDALRKKLARLSDSTKRQKNLVKLHEQSKRNLDFEINNYREEAKHRRRIIYQLEKERDFYIDMTSTITQKVTQQSDEIKEQKTTIFQLELEIQNSEIKFKQNVSLLESVKNEKNLYDKTLNELQREFIDTNAKLKNNKAQILQLKEDINTREFVKDKLIVERHQIEKNTENLTFEFNKLRNEYGKTKSAIQVQEEEECKLIKFIAEAEIEYNRVQKHYNSVLSKLNFLKENILEKSREIERLNVKLKEQEDIIIREEKDYIEKLEEIQTIQKEIIELRKEKIKLQEKSENNEILKRKYISCDKQMTVELIKISCLKGALEKPLNVHELRIMEMYHFDGWEDGVKLPLTCDPGSYEKVMKIQELRQRLKNQNDQIEKKAREIHQLELEYQELIKRKSRQPDPEVDEQQLQNKLIIFKKQKKLNILKSETEIYEQQVNDFNSKICKIKKSGDD